MLLNKTPRAFLALQAGSEAGLGLQDRRILILTDGKRTLNDVMALLGPDILPCIDRLLREGYISNGKETGATAAPAAASGLTNALTGLLRATTEAVQARTELRRTVPGASPAPATLPPSEPASQPAPAASAPATSSPAAPLPAAPATRAGHRRSLVAAKMYMIDMLQLQKHPDAVELKARIQFSNGEEALLDAIIESVQVLLRLTGNRYVQRVVTRLEESLPEQHLPRLAAFAALGVAADTATPPLLKLVGN
ncbi:MAG: hypothetical protein KGL91_08700 [Xanthomonadaceae bacterium]|nr:hypothetical protein [Xanthomonadaceae bacterium]